MFFVVSFDYKTQLLQKPNTLSAITAVIYNHLAKSRITEQWLIWGRFHVTIPIPALSNQGFSTPCYADHCMYVLYACSSALLHMCVLSTTQGQTTLVKKEVALYVFQIKLPNHSTLRLFLAMRQVWDLSLGFPWVWMGLSFSCFISPGEFHWLDDKMFFLRWCTEWLFKCSWQ